MLKTKIRRIRRWARMRPTISTLDYDVWYDTFKPETYVDGRFGTFLRYFDSPVNIFGSKYNTAHLWTSISENGKDYFITGYHTVNAISYVYTEKPWDIEYIVPIR